jgi:CubicO group peptidase (beta-lactamase class C family)
MSRTLTISSHRPAARRTLLAVAAAAAMITAAPLAAQAAGPVGPLVVTPGSTVCIKDSAATGAHAEGLATQLGAAFSVFRNGTVVYLTSNHTVGFGADFTGAGTYKLCATNNNSTNTKVTLTLLVH